MDVRGDAGHAMTGLAGASVVFRTDASLQIGTGHVMRCLTLAEALRERGATCRFVTRAHVGHRIGAIRARGFYVAELPIADPAPSREPVTAHDAWLGSHWLADAEQTLAALGDARVDWIVVDHYALESRWELAMAERAAAILVIDDLADRSHSCQLLLDQNLGRSAGDYRGKLPASCHLLLGPRYALLRPEFSQWRSRSLERRPAQRFGKILIAMGGVDYPNATETVLDVIDHFEAVAGATVVMGSNAPSLDRVAARISATSGRPFELKVDVSNMAELMTEADLAIGATGATTWERCALGLPSIVIATADNQEPVGRAVARRGGHWYLGRYGAHTAQDLRVALSHAVRDFDAIAALGEHAAEICDGQGVDRVIRSMAVPAVSLRLAAVSDAKMLFDWRNDPETRRHFFDPAALNFERHRQWVADVLADSRRRLLVAQAAGESVGCARLDLDADTASISIYRDPQRTGQGLGVAMLDAVAKWVENNEVGVKRIVAEVIPANRASRHAFESAGYVLSHLIFVRPVKRN